MPSVNHSILTWARETAGLTPEEAVKKLSIADTRRIEAVDRLVALEAGETEPTRSMLVKMAKQYRRPLLTFYLSTPPGKGDRGADFRSLTGNPSAAEDALIDALIRDMRARQSMVRAALVDEDEVEPLPFIRSMKMSDGQTLVLSGLETLLDVSVENFYAQPQADAGFNLLRTAVERRGVFVLLKGDLGSYHSEIDTEVFRGLTIADEVAPFIVINDRDARSAWSFTLLHECVHLLLGQTGIGSTRTESDIEQFCDSVAGEFLLQAGELSLLDLRGAHKVEPEIVRRISDFANDRNLSRTMVAYRAYRAGLIGNVTFGHLYDLFRKQWVQERARQRERNRQHRGGPNYYVVRRHRTGQSLISLMQRMMGAGALSTSQAARVLGIKPTQVGAMLDSGGPS